MTSVGGMRGTCISITIRLGCYYKVLACSAMIETGMHRDRVGRGLYYLHEFHVGKKYTA